MMMLTAMGRRVAGSFLMIPVLWYFGYFNWWLLAFAHQMLVTITFLVAMAVYLSPQWPDPSMDPVSAVIMNKEDLLPPGSMTHLTLVFYFKDCPDLERVKEDAKALLQYDRFCSVPVPNKSASFESTWRKVTVDFDSHFNEQKVDGEEAFQKALDEYALKPFVQPSNSPLWRMELLRNTNGTSAVVWRLCHSIGDGIGLLPVGYKFARTLDGKPAEPMEFKTRKPKSKSRSKGGITALTRKLNSAIKDIKDVANLANGAFDNCESINQNHKLPALVHNQKRVRCEFDFSLDDIKSIKEATGYTINDIVVALFAGCIRRYMEEMKDPALQLPGEKLKMTGLAPFAQPRGMKPGQVQNKMVFVHFAFPVGESSISGRLEKAHEEFDHLKRSIQVPLLSFITEAGTKLGIEKLLSQENSKIWHRSSWVFSNVPGPREKMVVFGKEMTSFKPYYCNVLHQAIFFSYAGMMSLGLVLDTESIAEPDRLIKCFQEELDAAKKMSDEMLTDNKRNNESNGKEDQKNGEGLRKRM
mmetsp:Transcript_11907/g.29320  ORF Transcript_11907/g.29320 Transcript_11907/m.29320 type:complete len:527 (+) Transcript_11907:232-1812(+)|eukprot:CAMPEP_0114530436 /NCGR_PEP_ID=MMETSP0109-20121206/25447_1 /TAXON_ID=29199 /ORGANISM="Chlorarachnion reptans, Strain CCCM449" /LENGTH=526 /DNA_ID=CAMNT_0001713065 /DNA_START=255 /DNA_END=1835 /DNA_ORIENTATION=+